MFKPLKGNSRVLFTILFKISGSGIKQKELQSLFSLIYQKYKTMIVICLEISYLNTEDKTCFFNVALCSL